MMNVRIEFYIRVALVVDNFKVSNNFELDFFMSLKYSNAALQLDVTK